MLIFESNQAAGEYLHFSDRELRRHNILGKSEVGFLSRVNSYSCSVDEKYFLLKHKKLVKWISGNIFLGWRTHNQER